MCILARCMNFYVCRWFHGKIKREDAEVLLKPREDGLFLVRESVNYPGDFTLSVCHKQKVEHYRIIYKQNQMTIDEESFFENLAQLVEVDMGYFSAVYFHIYMYIYYKPGFVLLGYIQ